MKYFVALIVVVYLIEAGWRMGKCLYGYEPPLKPRQTGVWDVLLPLGYAVWGLWLLLT